MLIKIYENYWSSNEKFNFLTDEVIKIEQSLDTYDIAELFATWYEITEYNKIEIYETWIPDKLVFKWLVHETKKTISILQNETKILCRSERAIMWKRKVLVSRDKNDTVENIVNELMADYPRDSWTTSIWFSQTIELEYNVWDDYESLLDEISLQCNGFWDIKDWVLIMNSILGEDKTWWSKKVDVIFTRKHWDNVRSVEIIWQSTKANIIIGEDDDKNTQTAMDISSGYIYGVEKFYFRNGDLAQKTLEMLNRLNIRQRILKVELDENMNVNANIGDKLNLEISNVENVEDIKSEVLVTKKTIEYIFADKVVNIEVWENIIKEDTLWNIIVGIKKELDRK